MSGTVLATSKALVAVSFTVLIISSLLALGFGWSLWLLAAENLPESESRLAAVTCMVGGTILGFFFTVIREVCLLPWTVRSAFQLWRKESSYRIMV